MKDPEAVLQQQTIQELLHQASIEQDREKLSELQQKIGEAFDRGESLNPTA